LCLKVNGAHAKSKIFAPGLSLAKRVYVKDLLHNLFEQANLVSIQPLIVMPEASSFEHHPNLTESKVLG